MAGAGYHLFVAGAVLTAAQVNTYVNEQSVMVFASAASRDSALSAVKSEGMFAYLKDVQLLTMYNAAGVWEEALSARYVSSVGAAQTAFTVVRRAAGVADSLGSGGIASGRYKITDGRCYYSMKWVYGTTGATAGAGVTTFDAPVAFGAANDTYQHCGTGHGVQAGVRFNFQVLRDAGGNGFQLYGPTQVTGVSPGNATFADSWTFSGSYWV